MPEKIKRVRRRRRISAVSRRGISLRSFATEFLRNDSRFCLAILGVAIVLIIFGFGYGSKIYRGWRESRLLQHAAKSLREEDFKGATVAAKKALDLHPDSLAAYSILADATEKENLIDTVTWRAQIARLRPG